MPKICIDPGHGGSEPGAINGTRYEKDDVLRLSKAVAAALEKQGVEAVLTRDKDIRVQIPRRCQMANAAGCDYFLSIHRDAASPTAYGISAWVWTGAGKNTIAQAQGILDHVLAVTPTYNRKVNKGTPQNYADFGVNSGTNMASCLLELGFIKNADDNWRFDTYFAQYTEAITKGLCAAVGVTYKTPATKPLYGVMRQVIALSDKTAAEKYAARLNRDDPAAYYKVLEI